MGDDAAVREQSTRRAEPCEVLIPADTPIDIAGYSFGLIEPIWVTANKDLVELLRLRLTGPDVPTPRLRIRPLTQPRGRDDG